jgi:hypothetical protein
VKGYIEDYSKVVYGPDQTCPGCGGIAKKWSGIISWRPEGSNIGGTTWVYNGWAKPIDWIEISAHIPGKKPLYREVCCTSCGVVELKKYANNLS